MNPAQLYTRHNEVPPLGTRPGKVSGNYYNHVQTALKRLGRQIRIRIPKLKHLDLILQKDAWIIVDKALYDYPIAAWTKFETEGRDSLHEPITCEIRYFHYAASMVLNRTLEAMELILSEEMDKLLPEDDHKILSFDRKKDE